MVTWSDEILKLQAVDLSLSHQPAQARTWTVTRTGEVLK